MDTSEKQTMIHPEKMAIAGSNAIKSLTDFYLLALEDELSRAQALRQTLDVTVKTMNFRISELTKRGEEMATEIERLQSTIMAMERDADHDATAAIVNALNESTS